MKLKGFTKEEIININENAKNYKIRLLKTYPDNGKHLKAHLQIDTGMEVVWNIDQFALKYVDGKSKLTKFNMWVVLAYETEMFQYNRQFRDLDKAVEYAYKIYKKHITKEYKENMAKLDEVLKER